MKPQHLILSVGRRAQCPLVEAQARFVARLEGFARVRLVRLRPSDPAREAREILAQVPAHAHLTVADDGGAPHTTADLATFLRRLLAASRPLVWAVGGAFGLGDAVQARAQARWALSPLTLPHRLALVVLTEQLYRAHTVLAGQPYHHAD